MCKIRSLAYLFFLGGIFCSFSLALQAQTNVVANPGFDTNLSGWTKAFGGPGEWSSEDAMGMGDSGSALLGNEGTGDGVVPFVLVQCFEMEGSGTVEWGGDLLVPNGQPAGTGAFVFMEPFDNTSCFGNPLEGTNSVSVNTAGDWSSVGTTRVTPSATLSVRISLGVLKPVGEMADAEAYFDNIYLFLPEDGGGGGGGGDDFMVNPSMSASWFNPAESGHGIMIHLLDANTAWMCWFTFTLNGEPAWICALGTVEGDTLVFEDAFTIEGGAFPPNYDPELIEEVPWGTITVKFTDCDNGTMTWVTNIPGFTSGTMPLIRLTPLWGATCP